MQCAFLLAYLDQHSKFGVAQARSRWQMQRSEKIGNTGADRLKRVSYALEQRHRHLQRECPNSGESIRG